MATQLPPDRRAGQAAPVRPTRPTGPIRPVTLAAASEVALTRPAWAWQHRIPVAGVTLMAGREGLGKTALAVHLMAAWTRGTLAGDMAGRPRDVIYCGMEDDRSSVLVPRLIAAGADLTRVLFVDLPSGASFSIGEDTPSLAASMDGRDVAAIVIDPLDAHLGGKIDSHKKSEVQATLAGLADLAQRRRCAVLGLAHLNKGDSTDVLTKVVGSVGFTTSVRSVLAVGEHPEDPADRVCALRKANMTDAAAVAAVRFRVVATEIAHPDGGTISTAAVEVIGEELGFDANAILSVTNAEERTAVADAVDWLRDLLSDGQMSSKEVKKYAKEADISERTLARARQDLEVVVARDDSTRGRPSMWSLGFVPEGFRANPCAEPLARNQNPPLPAKCLPGSGFRANDLDHGTKGVCAGCGHPCRDWQTYHPDCAPSEAPS